MYAWVIDKTKGKNKFGAKGPCYGWWLGFKARHPESAKLRKPDSLDRGRALFSTVNALREYFHLLKSVLDEGGFLNRPQDIYNCDETVIDLNKSSQKVVVPRRFKTSHSRQVASTEHITIHCCISAAGNTVPPFIIYKAAFPGGNYTVGGPDGALYGKQKTGFMDGELFVKWFTKIFIPHARPTADHSVLLLVDGHSSHCTPDVIQIARENNVILLALAPHTTHLCQPLDVAVYRSFKIHLSKVVKIGQALRGDLWISKSNVARIIKQPFEASMTMQNIKSGFRKCGIYPFNPNAIDKSQLFRNKLIPSEDVDLSLPPTESATNNECTNNEPDNLAGLIEENDDVISQNEIVSFADGDAILNEIPSANLAETPIERVTIVNDLEILVDVSDMPSSSASLSNSLSEDLTQIDDIVHLEDIGDFSPEISVSEEFLQSATASENDRQIETTESISIVHVSDRDFEEKETSTTLINSETNVRPNVLSNVPIKLKMVSKCAKVDDSFDVGNSIVVSDTMIDVGVQTENPTSYKSSPYDNPLITAGIVSEDLAEIFTPPDEKIPTGRKRPLRIKSKARIMTSQEVTDDLQNQMQEIEERNTRREAPAQRNTRGRNRGTRRLNPRERPANDRSSTAGRTMQVKRKSNRVVRKTRHVSNEDENDCYVCAANFYDESQINKDKWVGCESEECPHWVCPRCLPPDFDYNDDYFCDACA